ncbi:DUF2164 domain-containing protein [Brevundimonas sp. GCM10030266]|uniref:DUF2164 domain-containing protein n=1 Tax=Brevundimonas sp. GCM10030266 TaxID=3273386 RepID=UPI00360C7AF3
MKPVEPIKFSKEEMRDMVRRVQDYFDAELDQELPALPAEMLIEFFGREVGSYFYNRGLRDAQTVFTAKAEDVADLIYGLEQKPGGR